MINVYIDEFTPCLKDSKTGEKCKENNGGLHLWMDRWQKIRKAF